MQLELKSNIDKIGSLGIILTAMVTQCCFPLLGFSLAAFGFGTAEQFGGLTGYVFQGFVLLSLIVTLLSYKKHKKFLLLIIAVMSGGLIVYSYNISFKNITIYIGMFGLMTSATHNYLINRKHNISFNTCKIVDGKKVELNSKINCPNCGFNKIETMPTDTCQFFYECENCKTVLKPNKGDCCVYCSYGSVKCPSMQ